ncbi:hypothetical protein QJS66_09375 [Kocuria rhizophila]|nr:hypothetical protein QJS66_09375 [Kocuria rhizophila]
MTESWRWSCTARSQVTALLPGWVRTEFHSRAGTSPAPSSTRLDADRLAEEALADIARARSSPSPTPALQVMATTHAPLSPSRRPLVSRQISAIRRRDS